MEGESEEIGVYWNFNLQFKWNRIIFCNIGCILKYSYLTTEEMVTDVEVSEIIWTTCKQRYHFQCICIIR